MTFFVILSLSVFPNSIECELIMEKRPHEEIFSPSKRQCIDVSFSNERLNTNKSELNMSSLLLETSKNYTETTSQDIYSSNDLPVITNRSSTHTSDEPNSDLKDFIDNFFKDLDFQNMECCNVLTSPRNFIKPIAENTKSELSNAITGSRSSNSIIFQKELGNLIFLTLKLHNNQYYVNIREFNSEENPTKNGISMDVPTWYEFQYKIFTFNLKYKSSSFVANNNILVLNYNNSSMYIKNLKTYSHITLKHCHLENLKETACDLNEKLIHHMFTKHLPKLIKRKCPLGDISSEKELSIMTRLISIIEDHLSTIINRIYECSACIIEEPTQNLHTCFLYNTHEKFQQLGDSVLMLINEDFVTSVFSNEMECISKQFLYHINTSTITHVIFKTLK